MYQPADEVYTCVSLSHSKIWAKVTVNLQHCLTAVVTKHYFTQDSPAQLNRLKTRFIAGISLNLTAHPVHDESCNGVVAATMCKTGVCESGGYVRQTLSSGYLATPAGSLSGCGSPSCPWVLSPPRGQRFNLTVYNFVQIDTSRQHQQQQQASYSR